MALREKDLSVIIPAFNEERRIARSVSLLKAYLNSLDIFYEIIVVDDGSIDDTSAVVKKLAHNEPALQLIRNETNTGKGFAVKHGMEEAIGRVKIFIDADLSTPAEEIKNALEQLKAGYDVVIGSRRVKGAKILTHQPPLRKLFSNLFHLVRRLVILSDIKDTQCGFKAFTAVAADAVFARLTIHGFVFDVEALVIAHAMGFKIKEMGVTWRDDTRSTLTPTKHLKAVWGELMQIRKNIMQDKYK